MSRLKRSRNQKTQYHAKVPNAFGLPAGITCPGKTETCVRVCYASHIEKFRSNTGKLLHRNLELLQSARTVAGMAKLLEEMVIDFVDDCERREAPMYFRIHWDGDFFSLTYARAWARVINKFPQVQFWAYTRSFHGRVNVVPILAGLPNLALYLSMDTDNRQHVAAALVPGVRVAALAQTMAAGEPLVREIIPSGPVGKCPENTRQLPLLGACAACKICPTGNVDIRFSIKKGAA